MPSTYKTQHLGLNSWIGADKPKRNDFNEDNEIIDEAFTAHLADAAMHVTAEEKAAWNAPFITGSYAGDGITSRIVTLEFTPRVLFIGIDGASPVAVTTNGEVYLRTAFATACGCTKGLTIVENGFRVNNVAYPPPDGESSKLNMDGYVYFYLAFK